MHKTKEIVSDSKTINLISKAIKAFANRKHLVFSQPQVEKIYSIVFDELNLENSDIEKLSEKSGMDSKMLKGARINQLVKKIAEKENNKIDTLLIEKSNTNIIVKYEKLIGFLVSITVIGDIDCENVKQTITEKLIAKVVNGKLVSNGKASFYTFLNKVIRNLIIDELRKLDRRSKKEELHDPSSHKFVNQNSPKNFNALFENPLFVQHLAQLKTALLAFKKRNRFEISLKVLYYIQLLSTDIRKPYPDSSDDLLVEILSVFGLDYTAFSKGQIYKSWYPFICALEGEPEKQWSSLQKWFDRHKQVIFDQIFPDAKGTRDAKDEYFELLVYKLYDRI